MRLKKGDFIIQTDLMDNNYYILKIIDNKPKFDEDELEQYEKYRWRYLYIVDVIYTEDKFYKNLRNVSWAIGYKNDCNRKWEKRNADEIMIELL